MINPSQATADSIRQKVLDAMQDAEEMHGPEVPEYIALMESLAAECRRRAETASANTPRVTTLFYFDVAYHDGLWSRQWCPSRNEAERERARLCEDHGWPAPDDPDREHCGEAGDITEVDSVTVEVSTTGILRLLDSYANANDD